MSTAHRLISTLLLLQRRGTLTAGEVADELEVSTRTARRDLEALATAGVPVYSRAGRGGGWSLVGGARTDLTGLTADEARALFVVAGPAATASPELKSALRKLVRALPETFRTDADLAAEAVVIDPTRWGAQRDDADDHLTHARNAVVEGRRLRVSYADRHGRVSTRDVSPLGLVDKLGVWYLLADTDAGRRTFRLSRVESMTTLGERVERPADFDLDRAWAESSGEFLSNWERCQVELVVDADAVHLLKAVAGGALSVGERTNDGRMRAELTAPAVAVAASQLAGFGACVEILDPPELREQLARLGRELLERNSS